MYLQKLAQEREHEHRSLDAEKELPQTKSPPSGVFQRVIEMRDCTSSSSGVKPIQPS